MKSHGDENVYNMTPISQFFSDDSTTTEATTSEATLASSSSSTAMEMKPFQTRKPKRAPASNIAALARFDPHQEALDVQRARTISLQLRQISKILPHIYLSGDVPAKNAKLMKDLEITHVLVAASELKPYHPEHFTYKHLVELDDRQDAMLLPFFDECVSFIKEGIRYGGNILIHCMAGMNRSVAILMAYMISQLRLPHQQALQMIQRKRPLANPHEQYLSQIKMYEKMKCRVLHVLIEDRERTIATRVQSWIELPLVEKTLPCLECAIRQEYQIQETTPLHIWKSHHGINISVKTDDHVRSLDHHERLRIAVSHAPTE